MEHHIKFIHLPYQLSKAISRLKVYYHKLHQILERNLN
jgi:hypothetical protein